MTQLQLTNILIYFNSFEQQIITSLVIYHWRQRFNTNTELIFHTISLIFYLLALIQTFPLLIV